MPERDPTTPDRGPATPDGYVTAVPRDILVARGPEAQTYLQGQLSQDVAALADGDSALSWVLAPTGKVDALVRVTRAGEEWIIDTDAGFGEAVLGRLTRFKLRTKVELEAVPWRVLGLRGPDAPAAGATVVGGAGTVAVVDASWPGWAGVDLIGPDPAAPAGWRPGRPGEYEGDRIRAGVPVMGTELTERTIPAETGLVARTVSFTKGCYTGQELVARIDSRGSNVPRRLRRLDPAGPVGVGDEVRVGGDPVGAVTSAAVGRGGAWVALAYIRRGVDVPARAVVGDTATPAEVVALPE